MSEAVSAEESERDLILAGVRRRVIRDVEEYYAQWHLPIAFETVSRSHCTLIKRNCPPGSVIEDFVREIDQSGGLYFLRTPKGKKVLLPVLPEITEQIDSGKIMTLLGTYDESPIVGRRWSRK